MNKQLDLFNEEPRYSEYVDKYLDRNKVGWLTIVHLFKKHCGETALLDPTKDNIKDRIFTDLENYGGLGDMDDVIYQKWLYKHIVNMYHYVREEYGLVQPIQDWTAQIRI